MANAPFMTRISLVFALCLALFTLWFFKNSAPNSYATTKINKLEVVVTNNDPSLDDKPLSSSYPDLCQHSQEEADTFYDDPTFGYSIDDEPIKNWDEKRRQWLKIRPSLGGRERILVVTGSQPRRCRHPDGDHYLLRLFKNKVDYCRIHGHQVYYSNTFLHPKMRSYWVKLPVVYAAMLAHPESEWIWWVDSDAVFTDMEFALPLRDYKDYNMVLAGQPADVFEKKSWVGLNAGVFLIRNCQWSLDLIREWASIGPISPDFEKMGLTQQSVLSDKMHSTADDQSSLTYLLLTQRKKWANKVYLESSYFQTWWPVVAEKFENVAESYAKMDSTVRELGRRRGEVETMCFAAERERYFEEAAAENNDNAGTTGKRPFLTHFCGCAPCSGTPNATYKEGSCLTGLEKALNFADNQVLRSYGFVHRDLRDLENVSPLPFDFSA